MGTAEVLAVEAAVLAEAVSPGAYVAETVGTRRCRVISGSVALAEYQKECLASVHAFLALGMLLPLSRFLSPLGNLHAQFLQARVGLRLANATHSDEGCQ